jgi:hypothetical protein
MEDAAQGPASKLSGLVAGACILALACAARLALIGTARFGGDEIIMFQMAERISRGEEFPLLGTSITGGGASHPGPAFFYLMTVPLLCGFKSPEAANAFVALLCACGVLLYWRALRPFFGEAGAATAAVLMACLPWSTLYADRIWNANVINFFIAVAFWAACRLRRRPDLRGVVLLGLSAGVLPQFHMSSPMVWVALVPIAWPARKQWRWSWTLALVVCALALYAPLLVHEARTQGHNTRTFLAETGGNTSTDWLRTPLWALRLLTLDVSYHQLFSYWDTHSEGQMLDLVVRGNADVQWTAPRRLLLVLSYIFALGTLAFLLVRRLRRGPAPASSDEAARADRAAFLRAALLGLAANTLLLWAAHKSIFGHYVQPLLPFYFVAFAALGQAASDWGRARYALYGVVGVLCAGGLDSALWVSRTLDARNGLTTLRTVLGAIQRDRPALRAAKLQFDYRSQDWGYNVVLGLDPASKLRFDKDGPVYQLRLRRAPPLPGARLIVEAGPIVAWALP